MTDDRRSGPKQPSAPTARTFTVPEDKQGERLDRVLSGHLSLPRNQIQKWLAAGHILVDGERAKPSHKLNGGESVSVSPPPVTDGRVAPEAGELALLYEDQDLIVIDKPAGLTVHPGAGRHGGTLVNRLVERFPEIRGVGGSGRPGIVHRLDKDTTGVLVVARSHLAYQELSQAFAEHRIGKRYLAIVYGRPRNAEGRVDLPIGRHPRKRKEMTVRPGGRRATSRFRVHASASGMSLLEVVIETGRTHQIRVHLKAIGHPLVGDPVYGENRFKTLRGPSRDAARRFSRPALHAWNLELEHPRSGERMTFRAAPPADLRALWESAAGNWPEL